MSYKHVSHMSLFYLTQLVYDSSIDNCPAQGSVDPGPEEGTNRFDEKLSPAFQNKTQISSYWGWIWWAIKESCIVYEPWYDLLIFLLLGEG